MANKSAAGARGRNLTESQAGKTPARKPAAKPAAKGGARKAPAKKG